ncbi:MAG: hypothetical protein ACWGQW_10540 [bacterium]
MSHTVVYICLGLLFAVFWFWSGILGYGALFAFFQRHNPEGAPARLYKDMRTAMSCIPWGFLGLGNAINYLSRHDAWDWDARKPKLGSKYLPRHEYRYHG